MRTKKIVWDFSSAPSVSTDEFNQSINTYYELQFRFRHADHHAAQTLQLILVLWR